MKRVRLQLACYIKRQYSVHERARNDNPAPSSIEIRGKVYNKDEYTNVTPKILSYVGRNIYNQQFHPICLIKQRITDFFHSQFKGRSGNPVFSVHDNMDPVVSVQENFDSLLIPVDHVSRSKSDCYYLNKDYMLRSHATAHQSNLIQMGLDNFIIFGDVYRRDEIDRTHFPVFHQADGVFSLNEDQMEQLNNKRIKIFSDSIQSENEYHQSQHTAESTGFMENHLKNMLTNLATSLFGSGVQQRWVSAYFPFTHPSWELEVMLDNKWTEILGCGIVRHEIMEKAGAVGRIGWAFGLGLERYAMLLYCIPDIRIFWSEDRGFLSQFKFADPYTSIVYKPVSIHPPCYIDMSFWLPADRPYCKQDFLDLVRNLGGDCVEQVELIDEFVHPKKGQTSHCYRITYRHMHHVLRKEDVNILHRNIGRAAVDTLSVQIRA